jgi:hypothetical protein
VLLVNSFLLAALVGLLWARSCFAGDSVRIGGAAQHLRLASGQGIAIIQIADDGNGLRWPRFCSLEHGDRPEDVLRGSRFPDRFEASIFNRIGFGFDKHVRDWAPNDQLVIAVFLPYWALLILFGRRAITWSWRHLTRPTVHRDQAGDFAWCPRCCTQHEVGGGKLCRACKGPLAVRIRDDLATM